MRGILGQITDQLILCHRGRAEARKDFAVKGGGFAQITLRSKVLKGELRRGFGDLLLLGSG